MLVSGFVSTWLLAVLVALPVTAKLLALAAPGCLLGLLAAKHVGTGGDKWMLVPITLLWLWCAAVPFLDDVTCSHRSGSLGERTSLLRSTAVAGECSLESIALAQAGMLFASRQSRT